MGMLTNTSLSAIAFVLLAGAPLLAAEQADQNRPRAATQAESVEDMGAACAGTGKCCGSSACAEAKRKSIREGKAAVADCPCRKNRAKPNLNVP